MKSLIQNLGNGSISLVETEIPIPKENQILVKTNKTLISSGTEKMLIEFGKSNFFNKIKKNKDKVDQVIDKIKTVGLKETLGIVDEKLNTPIQIGYSNVGVVEKSNCPEFKVEDRVVSNGFHSDYVVVDKNLCAKIPNEVNDNDAIFSILSSIALNGVRKCETQLNDNVVVYGFGLIGMITAKLLENLGVNIIVVDNDENKRSIAENYYGYPFFNPEKEELEQNIKNLTNNQGADSIIICTYTKSNDPIIQSSKIIRKRGIIMLIGICGLDLSRDLFYEKEAKFQVSKSYGPGRYDYNYEKLGIDYPYEYVRWTQKRNIQSILNLISKNKLNFSDLIEEEIMIENYLNAYSKLEKNKSNKGIILVYKKEKKVTLEKKKINFTKIEGEYYLDCLGAGNHCRRTLLPIFKKKNINFLNICGDNTTKSEIIKKKFGFKSVINDESKLFSDKNSNFIIISTPHHLHANQLIGAIENNKAVFIEKPIAVNMKQLNEIYENLQKAKKIPPIHVNFNRRYSFFAKKMKSLLNKDNIKSISIDINSPEYNKKGSWLEDKKKSGGAIIGESCHFIDLSKFLVETKIVKYSINTNHKNHDFKIYLEFEDGSSSNINYYFSGNKSYPKEQIKVFSGNSVTLINDFQSINHVGKNNFKKKYFFGQNKGHENSVEVFMGKLRGEEFNENDIFDIIDTTKISIELAENC